MADSDQDHNHQSDADNEEQRGEQTVTIEESGPGRKCLTIEIPKERITQMLGDNFDKLRGDAEIPGFRKGRAPLRLLRRRFGTAVRDDARGQLISESYTQAVEEEKLEVIGEPDVKDLEQIELSEDGPLTFKVEVEIAPEVELPALEGIKVDKLQESVTSADVDEEIELLRERGGRMANIEDAKVGEKDYVICDVRILPGADAGDDAEPIAHHPASPMIVHGKDQGYRGHVAGILVNDLGKQLKGKGRGDELSISMTGPTGHDDERIKDQPITLKLRVDAVQRVEPADMAQVQEQLGFDTAEELKTAVRGRIESRQNARQRSAMHKQVSDYLLSKVDLQLPEGLTQRQIQRTLARRRLELAYQGVPEQEIEQRVAEMRSASAEEAVRDLQQFFVLNRAAANLEVDVTEAEVNGYIANLAAQQGRRPEKMRQQMHKSGELEHLYIQIREQKTLDKIIEMAEVIEKSPEQADTEKGSETSKKKKTKKKTTKGKTKDADESEDA